MSRVYSIVSLLLSVLLLACNSKAGFAQQKDGIELKTELCIANFANTPDATAVSSLSGKQQYGPLRIRDGNPGALFGEPIYIKVTLTNKSKQRILLDLTDRGGWVSLALTTSGGSHIQALPQVKFHSILDGPVRNATGGEGHPLLSPDASYVEYLCLNNYFPLRPYGKYKLTVSTNFRSYSTVRESNTEIQGILDTGSIETTGGSIIKNVGVAVKATNTETLRVWNYNRNALNKLLASYVQNLSKMNEFNFQKRVLMSGLLNFPGELSEESWAKYIAETPSLHRLLHVLAETPTVTAANVCYLIAANPKNRVVDRRSAGSLLRTMSLNANTAELPDFSQAVYRNLAELDKFYPGLAAVYMAPSISKFPDPLAIPPNGQP